MSKIYVGQLICWNIEKQANLLLKYKIKNLILFIIMIVIKNYLFLIKYDSLVSPNGFLSNLYHDLVNLTFKNYWFDLSKKFELIWIFRKLNHR